MRLSVVGAVEQELQDDLFELHQFLAPETVAGEDDGVFLGENVVDPIFGEHLDVATALTPHDAADSFHGWPPT